MSGCLKMSYAGAEVMAELASELEVEVVLESDLEAPPSRNLRSRLLVKESAIVAVC